MAIVGGGLAGLAAAAVLAERGLAVALVEARGQLGGRAASARDPRTGILLDRCRHVALGCCTHLADFLRRMELDDGWVRHQRLHFIGPDGRQHDVATSRLPAPLHLAPAVWQLDFLSRAERWGVFRAMAHLARRPAQAAPDEPTAESWLRAAGQTPRAIELFWSPIILAALSEPPASVAVSAMRQVLVEGFLASRRAHELWIPSEPLSELFDRRASAWLAARGVQIHCRARVVRIEADVDRLIAQRLRLSDGTSIPLEQCIVAVPWHRVGCLFDPAMLARLPSLTSASAIPRGSITSGHLWFDRPIMKLPHAVLVGRLGQWVFRHEPHRYEVVTSGSHALGVGSRETLLARVLGELQATWPEAAAARLIEARVFTHPAAVFALRPGVAPLRASVATPVANLHLAGDWTATGWPATMEGAVRSGYRAAQRVLAQLGRPERIAVAELPRPPLVRWLCREVRERAGL